jgi:hypothetical protein
VRITKELALTATFVALLIGAQLALSFVAGVEVVTVLFATFCFFFGARRGMVVATVFSILRCFVFGFFPNVIILYLVYYNLFALIIGLIGWWLRRSISLKSLIIITVAAVILTACFTLIDNVITPLFYSFTKEAAKAYFLTSITTIIPQCVCALITVAVLFYPLCKAYNVVKL